LNINQRDSEYEMNATEEIRKKYNLIEASILIQLEKEYPRYTPIDKLATSKSEYPIIERYLIQMVDKGLVEKRWRKYRITPISQSEMDSFM
jgi:predicted transcriptional regulator